MKRKSELLAAAEIGLFWENLRQWLWDRHVTYLIWKRRMVAKNLERRGIL